MKDERNRTGSSALNEVLSRRAGWLAKSEAAKPKLVRRTVAPVREVEIVRDAAAFQGWKAVPAREKLLGRGLKPGDSSVVDFGEHLVGRLSLRLAAALGREGDVAWAQAAIDRMTAAARTHLWNEKRGLFVDTDGRRANGLGQAWMVLSGVATEAQARKCLEFALATPDADRPRTPYGYHYFVEALYVAGLRQEADDALLAYWGGMVEKGADTFWEAFVPGGIRVSAVFGSELIDIVALI